MRYSYLVALVVMIALPGLASAQFFSFGFGYGHRGNFAFGYRGYYGYPYYAPAPVYVYPAPAVVVARPVQVVEPPPAAVVAPVVTNSQKARITVILPDPNAEVYVQGQRMHATGGVRTFTSQELEPGKNYSYTLTVRSHLTGRLTDETRKVAVHAGEAVTVDFSQERSERLPPAEVFPR